MTRYIENPHGSRLIIGDHPKEGYICVDNGRGGTSMFLSVEQLLELEAACRNIRRRIQARTIQDGEKG